MKLSPTENHIVVKQVKPPQEVNGIIVYLDPERETSQESIVIEVGKGYNELKHEWYEISNIKPGDRILTLKHAGQDFADTDVPEGEKPKVYTIISYNDILAVIKDERSAETL